MCISLLCFTDYVIFSFAGHGLEVTVLQVTGSLGCCRSRVMFLSTLQVNHVLCLCILLLL